MQKVDFYFDFLSPYSYLAFLEISELLKGGEIDSNKLKMKPIPMAMAIKKYVDKGPAEIPPKRDFLYKVALNRAQSRGWILKCPDLLPFDSYPLLRAVESFREHPRQLAFISYIFEQVWGKGQVASLDFIEIGFKLHSLNEADLRERRDNFDSRVSAIRLKENLKEALSEGVFGVPSFVTDSGGANKELFWGQDSICHLRSVLNGETWYNLDEYAKFLYTQHNQI